MLGIGKEQSMANKSVWTNEYQIVILVLLIVYFYHYTM